MFPEQPPHHAFLMRKGLSTGVLVTETTLGEEFCGSYIQHNQLADFRFCQPLRADAKVDGRPRLRKYLQIPVPLRTRGEVRREQRWPHPHDERTRFAAAGHAVQVNAGRVDVVVVEEVFRQRNGFPRRSPRTCSRQHPENTAPPS